MIAISVNVMGIAGRYALKGVTAWCLPVCIVWKSDSAMCKFCARHGTKNNQAIMVHLNCLIISYLTDTPIWT